MTAQRYEVHVNGPVDEATKTGDERLCSEEPVGLDVEVVQHVNHISLVDGEEWACVDCGFSTVGRDK